MNTRFRFGENWQSYLAEHFDAGVLEKSKQSLKSFLPLDLEGKTFIDAGCGSGIHSLAALQLGARQILSFDYDEQSVAAARMLKSQTAPDSPWTIEQGSLLDTGYLNGRGEFDVVYCWGVPHHTGDMWQALKNLGPLVAPQGMLFVAIYNKVDGPLGSRWWLGVKRFYNSLPNWGKKLFGWGYIGYNTFKLLIRGRNPIAYMREYERKRGMSWRIDLIDWLGGYPYEYAKPEEIISLYEKQYGMKLLKQKTTQYIGCNQFVFQK